MRVKAEEILVCLMLGLFMCLWLINVPEEKITALSQPLPAGWCRGLNLQKPSSFNVALMKQTLC